MPRHPSACSDSDRACVEDLAKFAKVLGRLQQLLFDREWTAAWRTLNESESSIRCPQCRNDELANPWHVLSLVRQVKAHWEEWHDPCHAALLNALEGRLGKQTTTKELLVSELRFTQLDHSERFKHGEHAGRRIDWLADRLEDGRVSVRHASMLVHAVFFHGSYRALNNRHAVALHRYSLRAAGQCTCIVRCLPLLPELRVADGSSWSVVDKFFSANSSESDGLQISSHPGRRSGSRGGRETRVNECACVHVSNIPYAVKDDDLAEFFRRHGWCHDLVDVEIAKRPNGISNGYGWTTFSSAETAAAFAAASLPPLHGRDLRLKLDSATVATSSTPPQMLGGFGQVLCKSCHKPCASLVDTHLISDRRSPGFSRSKGGWDNRLTESYFCVARVDKLFGCQLSPHPDHDKLPFKLSQISCSQCLSDLGNVQTTESMEEKWVHIFGDAVAHFKAVDVILELQDDQTHYVEVQKWKALRLHLGTETLIRLADLTMAELRRLFGTSLANSNREVRLIPK